MEMVDAYGVFMSLDGAASAVWAGKWARIITVFRRFGYQMWMNGIVKPGRCGGTPHRG